MLTETILRLPAVKAATGLSRSTIYKRIASGAFPKPIPLGDHAVGWTASDINAWIQQCVTKGRETNQSLIST